MSFPPRHPMMRGMMMPPFGTYPPMGMMPMGMMPMPNMIPPIMRNPIIQKEPVINQAALNAVHEEKLPVTTVFVGNIHERAPDLMMKNMLQKCGVVSSWKRVQGTTGKLQAFGFCEYENPEATLRCMRLLNELQIVDKKLLVKVDAKTNTLLEEYKSKKNKTGTSRQTEFEKMKDGEVLAAIRSVMREHQEELNKAVVEEPAELSAATSTATTSTLNVAKELQDKNDKKLQAMKSKQQQGLQDGSFPVGEMDEEIQSLVSKEIRSFRDAHLNSEKDDSREKSSRSDRKRSRREDDRERDREKDRVRERDRDSHRDRERDRDRDREREKEREKDKEREREKLKERDREREQERQERERERQERHHSRSKTRDASPREDNKSRQPDGEDEEELYERKRLERRLREKEAAYQELLRRWESRERKKMREHEKEKQREKEKRAEENKESKRLREFLEDYNDERDDVKYYKGSALQQRLFERQKEIDSDDRDRLREREEVEEIRRKLQEEGRDDVEEEMARIEREREQHLMPCIPLAPATHATSPGSCSPGVIVLDKAYSPSDNHPAPVIRSEVEDEEVMMENGDVAGKNDTFNELDKYQDVPLNQPPVALNHLQNYASEDSDNEYPLTNNESNHPSPSAQPFVPADEGGDKEEEEEEEQEVSMDVSRGSKRKMTVHEAFNQDDDDTNHSHSLKKQRLASLHDESKSTTEAPGLSAEEKRKWIKSFIDRIPVEKDDLFAWNVDWSLVDNSLIEKRIKPWVNKKIVEYIGEDEPALSEFICKKVLSHTPPGTILSDISMVLDDEAEVFVMKMWRLLVYEIEAKKCGVIK